jgi:hypothetical protein
METQAARCLVFPSGRILAIPTAQKRGATSRSTQQAMARIRSEVATMKGFSGPSSVAPRLRVELFSVPSDNGTELSLLKS